MPISGSLKDVPLANIVQLVSESGKTGAFILHSGARTGRIFLRKGEIIHAQLGEATGENAISDLIGWQDANFLFKEDLETGDRSVQGSTMGLLMRASQRVDEWAVLRKYIPSTRMIPRLSAQSGKGSVSFTALEWSILSSFDPKRTIDDVAKLVALPSIEVCKILYGLVAKGLVELQDAEGA